MTNAGTHPEALERLGEVYRAAYRAVTGGEPKWSAAHLARRNTELLYGLSVRGQRVLEVGAGDGFLSHYLVAVGGAARAVSLDAYEGAGSMPENHQINLRAQEALADASRVEIVKADFRAYRPAGRFDLILFVNVLHHIVSSRPRLSQSREAFDEAVKVFGRCRDLLAPGGCVLVQELGRINLCPFPKYRRSMSNVDRRTKQPAREWAGTMAAAGLRVVSIRYRLPLNLPDSKVLRRLFDNPLAACFADSSYVIRAEAAAQAAGPSS